MTNFNERRNTLLYKNISLTLYSRKGDVSCVWEVSWRQGQTATLTPSSSDHSNTSFSSCCCYSTVGHWEPKALYLPLALNSASCPQLTPTDSNRLGHLVIFVWLPPASAVLPIIHTCASLNWRLDRASICYTSSRIW